MTHLQAGFITIGVCIIAVIILVNFILDRIVKR